MKHISTESLVRLLAEKNEVSIIDVREPSEVAEGKIPSAVNLPLSRLTTLTHKLNKQTDYYVICRSGGRSAQATDYLSSMGFSVTNVEGGMLDWDGDIQ